MTAWNPELQKRAETSLLLIVCSLFCCCGCAGLEMNPAGRQWNGLSQSSPVANITAAVVQTLYKAGDLQAAYDAVKRLKRQDPYSIETRHLEARIAFDLGLVQESLHAWQALAVLPVKSAEIQHEAGLSLVQLGAVSPGLRALKRAVEHAPERVDYHLDLSAAYLSSGNVHTAQAVLLQARKRHPADQKLSIAVARLFESQGNWNRAAHYYGLALATDPQNATWLRQRGRNLCRLGEWELALRDFADCEEELIAGEHWPALFEYGQACLKTNKIAPVHRIVAVLTEQSWLNSQLSPFTAALSAAPRPQPLEKEPDRKISVAASEPVAKSRSWIVRKFQPRLQVTQTAYVVERNKEAGAVLQVGGNTAFMGIQGGWSPTQKDGRQWKPADQPRSGWKPSRSHEIEQ